MNTDALLEGTITGIAAAIVIGVWTELSTHLKDRLLERKLRRSVQNFGVGSGIDGLSVTIHNRSDTGISVRGVAILGDDMTFMLNAEDEIHNLWSKTKPRIGERYSEMNIGTIFRKEDLGHYPDIPPHSSRCFRLHPDVLTGRFFPVGITAVVEFPLSSGGTKIFQVDAKEHSIKHLNLMSQKMKKEIESGSLDAARKLFGKRPVKKIGA